VAQFVETLEGRRLLSGTVSIGSANITEGDRGLSDMKFAVTLSEVNASPVSVQFATVQKSADADLDYLSSSGTLTFAPGETSKTIVIKIKNDKLCETAEGFQVQLSSPVNADLGTSMGAGFIKDNDPAPKLVVKDLRVVEGNSGTSAANFLLKLSAPTGKLIQVDYTTVDGSALAGTDYETTAGMFMFNPGESKRTITVPIIGDGIREAATKNFQLQLTHVNGADAGDFAAVGMIRDNDPPPKVFIGSVKVQEVKEGTSEAVFTVSLSAPSGSAVTVKYTTLAVKRTGVAQAGIDYTPITGVLTIPAGQTSANLVVTILGDTVVEGDEILQLKLSAPSGARIGLPLGTATIYDAG
jgi:large repetitive protein